jgi:eukaryotic-like serine/threonine-protein kinase
MIGTELEGRYRIDAELGSGGVGSVYRATHLKLNRAVAIKVLRPEYGASVELVQRFQREAQALAALSHPNVVAVTDYGVVADTPYLVMELLEGETLSERLRRGALDPADAQEVMRQLLAALAFVHESGLVHRDVKPGNVFLQRVPGEKLHVRLLDFGLAKFLAPSAGGRPITRAGQIFGTPSYMAPEQVAGQDADARADVYAAGIIFFEMLTGRTPFKGKTSEIMRLHLMEELPKLESVNPDRAATPALWVLLTRATAKGRAERFPTVGEFAAAIEALRPPIVVPPAARPSLASEATGFGPNSAPTRVDAKPAELPREAIRGTLRDETAAAVPEAVSPVPSPVAAAVEPEPLPQVSSPQADDSLEGPAPVRFVRSVVRVALSVMVLTSLGALLAAAAVVYFLVTPGHEKEQRVLEDLFGRTPEDGGAVPSASASGSAAAPAMAVSGSSPQIASAGAPSAEPAPLPAASDVPDESQAARADSVPAGSVSAPAPENPAPPGSSEALPRPPLGPAPDPWATVPRDLARLVSKVNKGQSLGKREIASIHQWNARHPDDPRGHLVLARGFLNKRWIKDAANEYGVAMKVNEGARGDPRMLKDLIRIVQFGSSEGERLVREVYGSAALAPIERALLESPTPEVQERLERLRSDLKG